MSSLNDHHDLATLASAGFFGTLTRLVLKPEKSWQRWLAQFVAGISSAVFLGGLVGQFLDAGAWGFAASGFVIGTASEQAIALAQRRFSGPDKEEKKTGKVQDSPVDTGTTAKSKKD